MSVRSAVGIWGKWDGGWYLSQNKMYSICVLLSDSGVELMEKKQMNAMWKWRQGSGFTVARIVLLKHQSQMSP